MSPEFLCVPGILQRCEGAKDRARNGSYYEKGFLVGVVEFGFAQCGDGCVGAHLRPSDAGGVLAGS